MRVVIADDSEIFTGGLVVLLRSADIAVTATATSGDGLVRQLEASPNDLPDIAVLDIQMPPSYTDEGLQTAQIIRKRWPTIAVLILSAHLDPGPATRLLADGGDRVGVMSKNTVSDRASLLDALHRLDAGEVVIDRVLVAALLQRGGQARSQLEQLTDKEREVLSLVAQGHTNQGIADALFVSVRTVETHISSIFRKLDLPPGTRDSRRVLATLVWLRDEQGVELPDRTP